MTTKIELSDRAEVTRAAVERRPVNPEVSRRVRERAERIRNEVLQTHGVLNVAVDLIREGRGYPLDE
jgi:hypothetical protein